MAERREMLLSSHFELQCEQITLAEFQEVSGLSSENPVAEYKAAGPKGQYISYKVPANPTYGNITIKRGVTDVMDLWEWRKKVEQGKVVEARQNGSIVLYSHDGTEVSRWNFINAWPTKLTGPSLNATSNDFAIEELELAVEMYERVK